MPGKTELPRAAADDLGRPLRLLFEDWPGVAVAESALPPERPPLSPAEAAQVERAVERRQVEFATARQCARRAAAELGVPPFVLLNGPDRAPLWPAGLVGSLTHTGRGTTGYCAAAVARAESLRSLGIDAEQAAPLPGRLWSHVLTPDEQSHLRARALEPEDQGVVAKIIFSAKECFYKAQFPLTSRYLGFQDVEIALDRRRETFAARLSPSAPADLRLSIAGTFNGRFALDHHLVKTALGIPY